MKEGSFAGFPSATFELLGGLHEHNTKEWFDAHQTEYRAGYVEAGKQFVVAAGEVLRAFAPGIEAEPKVLGSIFRINRDTRFSTDKRPYKDHLDFWFWEGDRKAAVSGFFLRVTPDAVGVGAGCHGFDKPRLASFRSALDDSLAAIASGLERDGYKVEGEQYARLPRGVDPDGPAARFGRYGALYVHVDGPGGLARDGATLLNTCRRHWRALAPLHRWLVDNVQQPRA
jgi:uncharacterized protein (TIGR02453 family)